jgi:hypothetical protein
MKCPNCEEESDDKVCPNCGTTIVSDPDDTIDTLVQQASIPSLATLFRQGKQAGLIKPAQEYGTA